MQKQRWITDSRITIGSVLKISTLFHFCFVIPQIQTWSFRIIMFDHSIYLDLSNGHVWFFISGYKLALLCNFGPSIFPSILSEKRCVQQTKIDQKWGFRPKLRDFRLRVTAVCLEILSQHFNQHVVQFIKQTAKLNKNTVLSSCILCVSFTLSISS